jgi:peptide deformylase
MKKWLVIICLYTISVSGNDELAKKMEITVKENPSSQYLYKILSIRDWQATQNRTTVQLPAEDDPVIHFFTENQLDEVISQYWTHAPQFVVVKIDSHKVEGNFIPISSIVESKIVYQQPLDACDIQKLDIVEVGHPVLRQIAKELSVEEILSPEIQDLIQTMKATMRAAPGVGLAAPQIGKALQIVVIEDMDHSHLTAQQLTERNRYKVPFHVLINPKLYIEESAEERTFFEGCLSVPKFVGAVPRAESVIVEGLNERGEPVVIHANGWYARILQHEIDHLNGTLYIDKAHLSTLVTMENYIKLHKDKSVKQIHAELSSKP